MIDISKVDDLTFTIRFDPQIAADLYLYAGWGTVENALSRILSDTLLGTDPSYGFDGDLDGDVPF